MASRTLYYPLSADSANESQSAIIDLSRSHEAHMVVQVIQIAPSVPIAVEVPLADEWVLEMETARAETSKIGRALEKSLHDAGVAAQVQPVVCERSQIEPVTGICARYADLGVVSNGLRGDQEIYNRTLVGLLYQSGKPILVEPASSQTSVITRTPETIMIAWDDSLPASRAVGHAMDLLEGASNVHVVCVDPKTQEPGVGQAPGWDLANYLSRHEVNVTVTELSSAGLPVDAVLNRHAMEIGAQLIVMGGYGHSRLRERLLGGTTLSMLENSHFPIIMAR